MARASAATTASIVNPLILRLAQERLPLQPVRTVPNSRKHFLQAPCGQTPGLLCSNVVVPLDRSGATPGSITLKVETLPVPEPRKGVMFLIAGGPGQGSAGSFALGTPANAAYYQFLFPGYTLVAFDNRGTGDSGFLDCPGLDRAYEQEQEPALVGACAEAIGPTRLFYGTDEHVEDLEAVRLSLGADKVGLWGTSYGTKLAGAYALAHPGNVERLLLDSVLPPDENEPFRTKSSKAIPGALASLCEGGACSRATRDFVGDVAKLANQLAAKPLRGKVRNRAIKVGGVELLSLVVDSDLSPGIAVMLPALVKAALVGNGGSPPPAVRPEHGRIRGSRALRRPLRGHGVQRRAVPVGTRRRAVGAAGHCRRGGRGASCRIVRAFRTVGGQARERRVLSRVAGTLGAALARRRPASGCPGAGLERRVRHAHATTRRPGHGLPVPPGSPDRGAGRGSQRARRRSDVLRRA